MPGIAASALIEVLRTLPLLDEGQKAQIETMQERFGESLSAELVRLGWLTTFQVAEIADGRAKDLILDQYVVRELLGEGGMGAVYRARQSRMKRPVALKLIRREALKSPGAVERFQREAQAAAQLSHPNIITVFDTNEVKGIHFLAMELIDGTDLAKLVRTRGQLSVNRACDYVRQAALGLQHAHEKGLIHRDIKPHNLMLTNQGIVKVMDLGLARLTDAEEESTGLTPSGAMMGTPYYMAPEQAFDARGVDSRADIYSLGGTLYHLLAGRPPYAGLTVVEILRCLIDRTPTMPLEELRPDLPNDLRAIVRRMMANLPADRYQTASAVAAALAPFAKTSPPDMEDEEERAGTLDAPSSEIETLAHLKDGATPSGSTKPFPSTRTGRARLAKPTLVLALLVATGLGIGYYRAPLLEWLEQVTAKRTTAVVAQTPDSRTAETHTAADVNLPRSFINSIGMKLVLIPAGEFMMGSPLDEEGRADEEKLHPVALTKPVYLAIHTVTVAQFRQFVQATGHRTDAEIERTGSAYDVETKSFKADVKLANWRTPGFAQADDHPVVNVSWNDAVAFCWWLSKKERKKYRLPTEAEWEYACRAGTTTRFYSGNSDASLCGVANIADRSLKDKWNYQILIKEEYEGLLKWFEIVSWDDGYPFTAPVGSFQPNAFGLYDMHGNVWQWCSDWYDKDYYTKSPKQDPQGPDEGKLRVGRGRFFTSFPNRCRSAFRYADLPGMRSCTVGFRVVCDPDGSGGQSKGK